MGIDILGHDNFALALQFDMLREQYGIIKDILIYYNIDIEENVNKNYPFSQPGDTYEVLHADLWKPDPERKLLLGAMAGKTMRTIYTYFNERTSIEKLDFMSLIHKSAYVADSASLGMGIIIEPNASVVSFANLSDHVWLKRNSSIGHHTWIESYTNINPGVTISSCCEVGEGCLIGVGATILDKIKIGKNCVIGAGSVVTKSIPDNSVAYGVPAKVMGENP